MRVHLVDGTYELFRHYYAVPEHLDPDGMDVGAVRGVVGSVLQLLEEGATHVGVATDHVIESFRNDMWPGYKTGDGVDPVLKAQFPVLEEALESLGVTVWAMVDQEADDALAAAAIAAAADDQVEQVLICTPDKDLAQCVVDPRIAQYDRRQRKLIDEAAVREKFGVSPGSIPDYLALVGDSADGFPGLPGWGAKSAGAVLARYEHLEEIPVDPGTWEVSVRGAAKLAATLVADVEAAFLFRDLATLRVDAPVGAVDEWAYAGPADSFEAWAERLGVPAYAQRAHAIVDS
jgi:5'-3' exonuclease